jgi:hypothetical protein
VDGIERRGPYLGVFLVSLAMLMDEILLTRIFSVTMWYHYAFAAISIAMFGMTVGANFVYLFPHYFLPERARRQLAVYSFWFSVAVVLSFLSYLCIPMIDPKEATIVDFFSIALIYFVVSIPFIFGGICICIALTRFADQVSGIYAADLAGAAAGCAVLVYLLDFTDGPTAVLFVALFASLGTLAFLSEENTRFHKKAAVTLAVFLAFLAFGNTIQSYEGKPFLKLRWVKGRLEPTPLYERWNSFSRVQVHGDAAADVKPGGWGISPAYVPSGTMRQLALFIDSCARTDMTWFGGDLKRLDFLKNDVVNFAYHVRPATEVLVVGTGGGRDILSALVFGAKSVVGVEINENILDAVNNKYGEFTGHLDQDKRVRFVNDEARSYITRQSDHFDIIQVPMIDTWAATAAGAFVLSENSLYTVEAWTGFLEKLKPRGILTFSRWYIEGASWEMCRLASLAVASLKASGVKNPRDHLFIVNCPYQDGGLGIGCLLVSKSPFTPVEIGTLEYVVGRMKFKIDLSPRTASNNIIEGIVLEKPVKEYAPKLPVDLSAPTDDSPFFFNMQRFNSMMDSTYWTQGPIAFNMKAIFTLGTLLITAVILTLALILLPLYLKADTPLPRGTFPLFLFFASIGFGFMLIEISQMQRLVVFLGHPVYGLSVVLFSLLLSAGAGSYLTQRIVNPAFIGVILLILLLAVLALFGHHTPALIARYRAETNLARILLSVGILSGIGIFLGMPFPLGMKVAMVRSSALSPWLWGINGSASVLASIIAVVIALAAGISASYWTGVGCYGVALVAFIWACLVEGYSTVPPQKVVVQPSQEPIEVEALSLEE